MSTSQPDYDVAVVGAGGAGLAAALEAARAGARVLLVDAAGRTGGSTALSGGVYYAAGTSVQRARGIVDTPDALLHHYLTLNRHDLAPALARKLCFEAAANLEWLLGLGVEFRPEDLYNSGTDAVLRGHRPVGRGAAIAAALDSAVSRGGVDVALNSRVSSLTRDAHGVVRGLCVGTERISAHAVVLTTGGFGANRALLERYYPDAMSAPEWAWYIGVPEARGDGLQLGLEAGATLTGQNRGLVLITHGFAHDNEPDMPGWLLHVNRGGRRFVKETTNYTVVAELVKLQTGRECFGLFDEDARLACVRATERNPSWEASLLEGFVARGRLLRAPSLEVLAGLAGIERDALLHTVGTYNQAVATGVDGEFFKDPAWLKPLARPPFYAARFRPATIALTSTGLAIDSATRVLDARGAVIPGLYAAGETTGGVLGEIYAASGNSITNAIVFGRTAGQSAALQARQS